MEEVREEVRTAQCSLDSENTLNAFPEVSESALTDRRHEPRAWGSVSRERVTQRQMEAGPATTNQTRVAMTQGPWVTPWALDLILEHWGWVAQNPGVSTRSRQWDVGEHELGGRVEQDGDEASSGGDKGGNNSGSQRRFLWSWQEGGAGGHLIFLAWWGPW